MKSGSSIANTIGSGISKLSNIAKRGGGNDAKYFQTTKRGEIHELKSELHSSNKDKKKEAVKRVIASMTVGKDVSSIFADVVNCMQTTNIELKKLVYLYVINYAKTQPELAILAVNTFRKDSLDTNPLIRSLAVRTMGCIKLQQITEYLAEPLRKTCKDPDPYVRKTAAICIAKLFDTSPDSIYDNGFIDVLRDMLGDTNPMVVANAVVALNEISESSGQNYLKLHEQTVSNLLTALNECTEWGQVFILDAVSSYTPRTSKEAETLLERVAARLSHANAAVVMSAVKVVMKLLDCLSNFELVRTMQRKLCPPLVTLLSMEPEIQYVVLRNMELIIQKRPAIFSNEVKVFFCKYNDPIYVKMEKLELIVRLANERNVDQVLNELREYATEVDIEFVRKAVRSIGRCAIKIETAAQRCINVLLSLISTRVNYVIQEAIVVIKDIFRRYPNQYEQVIGPLCENLSSLDEPESKASMIWIIGEYAERIDKADELLESFIESFFDETPSVQLQILTSTVKLFLKSPKNSKELVSRVLKMSTEENDNPDLRDRGYIYWRLLSTNPEATKRIVLSERPIISENYNVMDSSLLDKLIENISLLASVYHKLPQTFVVKLRQGPKDEDASTESDDVVHPDEVRAEMRDTTYSSGSESDYEEEKQYTSSSEESTEESPTDLIDMSRDKTTDRGAVKSGRTQKYSLINVLTPDHPGVQGSKGLAVSAALTVQRGKPVMILSLSNQSHQPLTNWAMQINRNTFGLAMSSPLNVQSLAAGSSTEAHLNLTPNELLANTPQPRPMILQVAIRTSMDIFYLNIPYDLSVVLVDIRSPMDKAELMSLWSSFTESNQQQSTITNSATQLEIQFVTDQLKGKGIDYVTMRSGAGFDAAYYTCRTTKKDVFLIEICLQKGSGRGVKCNVKSKSSDFIPFVIQLIYIALGLKV